MDWKCSYILDLSCPNRQRLKVSENVKYRFKSRSSPTLETCNCEARKVTAIHFMKPQVFVYLDKRDQERSCMFIDDMLLGIPIGLLYKITIICNQKSLVIVFIIYSSSWSMSIIIHTVDLVPQIIYFQDLWFNSDYSFVHRINNFYMLVCDQLTCSIALKSNFAFRPVAEGIIQIT